MFFALIPVGGGGDWFPQADKLRHAATFMFLWLLGQRARIPAPRLAVLLLAFGVGIEVAQSFTPDREASSLDVLADSVGILLGWRLIGPAA
jgi:VanZ family protein